MISKSLIMIYLVFSAQGQSQVEDIMTKIEASTKNIQSMEFKYESFSESMAIGIKTECSGIFRIKGVGTIFVDEIEKNSKTGETMRVVQATMKGVTSRFNRRTEEDSGIGYISADPLGARAIAKSPAGLLIVYSIIENHKDPNKITSIAGTETLDSVSCLIVSIAPRKAPGNGQKYWIALDRGMLPMKSERYFQSKLATRSEISLSNIVTPQGHFWVPVRVRSESYAKLAADKKKIELANKPTGKSEVYILSESLKINEGLSDSMFVVTFPKGATVSDRIKNNVYKVGQITRTPKTAKESEVQLKTLLAEAASQEQEFRASPAVESGRKWWAWLPWVIAGLAAAVLCVLTIRRIRGGPH